MVDFFRTVNKDAHLLKTMGSDGVQGCGGLVVRVFASCLRRVGIGNPGVSVESMAFGSEDPLDFSTSMATAARARASSTCGSALGGRGASVRDCGELMDEDQEEEEDDADQEELSAQV